MANPIRTWKHRPDNHTVTDVTGVQDDLGAHCGRCRKPVFRVTPGDDWQHLEQEFYLAGRGAQGRVEGVREVMVFDERGGLLGARTRETDIPPADLAREVARQVWPSSARTVLVAQIGAEAGYDSTGVGSDRPSGRQWLARVTV